MARLLLRGLSGGKGEGAVRGLELALQPGEVVAVLGDRAEALTTLARTIAGLEPAREGTIHLDEKDATSSPCGARGVSLVLPSGPVFPHLDVRENIELGQSLRGVSAAVRDAKVAEVAALFGFEGRLGLSAKTLSPADRIRIALARALTRESPLVLLDDALGALEAETRAVVRADVARALRKTKATALVLTREPAEAFALASRVAVVHAGRLEQAGTHEELARDPVSRHVAKAVGHLFFELPVTARTAPFGGVSVPVPTDAPAVLAALSPDAFSLDDGAAALAATTELVEPLPPADALVSLRAGSTLIPLRTTRARAPHPGEETHVRCDPARLVFFEASDAGPRLREPVPATAPTTETPAPAPSDAPAPTTPGKDEAA